MVIDSFLFFDEIDLLKLRLRYLDEYVDKFIIVEASQTFSGNVKPFNFTRYCDQLDGFKHKIEYIQVPDTVTSFEDLQRSLAKKCGTSKKILEFLTNHKHYDKRVLRWLLDSYHRECIHYGLQGVSDEDICIVSDLDEIPNLNAIQLNSSMIPTVCIQNMFSYYVNYYRDPNWLGSIIAPASWMKEQSLNTIRLEAKNNKTIVFNYMPNGGYHFSSVGRIEQIRHKMGSWAHQELNTYTNRFALAYNLARGRDIFNRSTKKVFHCVTKDSGIYDTKMAKLLVESEFSCGPKIRAPKPMDFVYSHILWATNKLEQIFYRLTEQLGLR
jgi:beta-1,4-mannosyl-glycoprotein beta-1,4-N-acetylglucosaminyltransferase